MTKTELLNKAARNGEERLLLARVLDKLELARRRNIPSHTGFLSPGERACVEALLAAAGHPRHLFFGGYEGAQRNICVFLPDWQEPEDFQTGGDCPVCALRASFPADGALTHRDFLGSVLGLGLDREKVGDLLVGEGACDLIVLEEIRDFLLLHLEQAGGYACGWLRWRWNGSPRRRCRGSLSGIRSPPCGWTRWPPPAFPWPGARPPTSFPRAASSSTTGSASNPTGRWPRGT